MRLKLTHAVIGDNPSLWLYLFFVFNTPFNYVSDEIICRSLMDLCNHTNAGKPCNQNDILNPVKVCEGCKSCVTISVLVSGKRDFYSILIYIKAIN